LSDLLSKEERKVSLSVSESTLQLLKVLEKYFDSDTSSKIAFVKAYSYLCDFPKFQIEAFMQCDFVEVSPYLSEEMKEEYLKRTFDQNNVHNTDITYVNVERSCTFIQMLSYEDYTNLLLRETLEVA
jgi:hypothetical protein